MKFFRSVILISVILLQSSWLLAQSDSIPLSTIIQKTQKFAQEYPKEKVYLHFDKPYYAIGDTVWFKGYVALGQNQPSDLSKVLYVDIISEKDSVVRSVRLPVINTSAYGAITLDPAVYKTGNYRFRAYTYWMLNFNERYFFSKNIRVGNAINNQLITNASLQGISGDKPKVLATVTYRDGDGKPYANKKVGWQFISKFETLDRGRATTDANGKLTLSLSANQQAALDTGHLETILEVDATKQHKSIFQLKNSFAEADVQFFPEGGELLQGVRSKIAFKALQANGKGIGTKGQITDNEGKAVAQIEAQHLGMGTFYLVPETGKNYTAELTFDNGLKKTFPLPKVSSNGVVLSAINTDPQTLNLRLSSSNSFFTANQNKSFYIVAQSKGIICYAAQTKLASPVFAAAIPKNKFPTGVVQITLFSNAGEPLTERLVFIKNEDQMVLTLSSDKKTYSPRQPVKMTAMSKTRNTPVQGNYSVSVINETLVPNAEDDETTILSSFLLSSELTGYIEKPNYYFNQINDRKLQDLDVLMLTQGYRKFSYKDILNNKNPAITFFPEQGIEYTGTLRSSNGMPISRGRLNLVVPDSRFYTETATDAEGRFHFKGLNIPDSAEVSITARSNTGSKNMMIMLDGSAFPAVAKNINAPDEILNLDSALAPYLANSKRQYRLATQLLQEVVITSTVINKPSHADYPALSSLSMLPDHLIDGERLKGCNLLLSCLQTAAAGLTYDSNEQNFFVTRVYNSGLKVPVQIFYNGMPVDFSYLNSIQPSDIESIEVFLKDELGMINRTYNTNGALVINGKKAAKGSPVTAEQLKKLFPPSNVLTFSPLGYLKQREFYQPKYATSESKTKGADFRTTVYWNPKVFTDEKGIMSFEFYNGDNRGTYKAILEGTDIEGNLGRVVYRYKVE